MNKMIRYGLEGLLAAALPLAFVACDNEAEFAELPSANFPSQVLMEIPAAQQQLIYEDNGTRVLPLVKGEALALSGSILPADATIKEMEWSSSDEQVVTIDAEGHLTAVGEGYAVIQLSPVACYPGSGIPQTLKVLVVDRLVPATSLVLTADSDELYAGETLQLGFALQPADVTYRTVKWSSSNEAVATVDANGLVTGKVSADVLAKVTITATTLDGGQVMASKELSVLQIVQPESVTIDPALSADNGHVLAIADKQVRLQYTTVPANCTLSLIEWTSSDEEMATVKDGVVTLNQQGHFGDVTITAKCPATGNTSSVKLHIEEGLVRELFHDKDNYGWYNAKQSGNGTSSSHVWHDGHITITTYMQNATTGRADIKCWNAATWFHVGKYPIFAFRMDDVKDVESTIKSRNINIDAVGVSASGKEYKAIAGGNNKYLYDYLCSDGSHVFVYNLAEQACGTGGLMPTNEWVKFTTLQIKHADMKTVDHQIDYNLYWVQTFKSMDDLHKYIASEGLTFEAK